MPPKGKVAGKKRKEIKTKKKVRRKQDAKADKLLNEMKGVKGLPIPSEEIEEVKSIFGPKQLAAFLIGTAWPEMSYEKIAVIVGISSRSIYEWRQDAGFQKEVKRYGEEHIERDWLPIVRAQVKKARGGDTEAFNAIARVLGKAINRLDITATTPEMKRMEDMSDEDLKIYIAELRAGREAKKALSERG